MGKILNLIEAILTNYLFSYVYRTKTRLVRYSIWNARFGNKRIQKTSC